ncbi:MAG: phosphonoacetaldehyde dehydrogenase [Planctomycetes bacterium]|nr:phosphonoacetaldehyde dehydrogenase [Planctomycetota bacterium]
MSSALELSSLHAGEPFGEGAPLEVFDPWNHELVGTVRTALAPDVDSLVQTAQRYRMDLTRHRRHEILVRAREGLEQRSEEFAHLISREAGLCLRETRYEVGRACDVLLFAAQEALRDDGQIFSCDVTPQGKARKIFTLREPLRCVLAITPFNHPLNQVAHKLAPAIAAGAPVILKPSEKTPLTALRFAELLYDAGLPGPMLSVVLGDVRELVEPLVRHADVELVSFTGSVAIGKHIASTAGYKKVCLELGGNSPLIVLADADLEKAVTLAAEGCYRNSGQRCTAVKRLLVQSSIVDDFTERFVAKSREYVAGDPRADTTRVGTVIDVAAATRLQEFVEDARQKGAQVLLGGERDGALFPPTVLANMSRDARIQCEEAFGPLAPIFTVEDVDDAITLANASPYGLSSGIVTNDLEKAMRAVREIRTGTVNVNEVPGYRIEASPFGGVKDSGLGIKEGVIEAIRYLTNVKTFSLPW